MRTSLGTDKFEHVKNLTLENRGEKMSLKNNVGVKPRAKLELNLEQNLNSEHSIQHGKYCENLFSLHCIQL